MLSLPNTKMRYVYTKENPQTSHLFLGFSRGRLLVTIYASPLHTHVLVQLPLSMKLGQVFQKKSIQCNSWFPFTPKSILFGMRDILFL